MLICDGCGKPADQQHWKIHAPTHQFCDLDLCNGCAQDLTAHVVKTVDGWKQPRAKNPAGGGAKSSTAKYSGDESSGGPSARDKSPDRERPDDESYAQDRLATIAPGATPRGKPTEDLPPSEKYQGKPANQAGNPAGDGGEPPDTKSGQVVQPAEMAKEKAIAHDMREGERQAPPRGAASMPPAKEADKIGEKAKDDDKGKGKHK